MIVHVDIATYTNCAVYISIQNNVHKCKVGNRTMFMLGFFDVSIKTVPVTVEVHFRMCWVARIDVLNLAYPFRCKPS